MDEEQNLERLQKAASPVFPEFDSASESWQTYIQRLKQYFHEIMKNKQKIAATVAGSSTETSRSRSRSLVSRSAFALSAGRRRRNSFDDSVVEVDKLQRFSTKDASLIFCTEQLKMSSALFFKYVKDNFVANYVTLIDLMENLLWLHDRALNIMPYFAADFAYRLQEFLLVAQQLFAAYDPDGTQVHFDWTAIADHMLRTAERRKRETIPFVDYIPKLSDFLLMRELGKGGYGSVYQAVYQPAKITCAVKLVTVNLLKRMIVEKMIAAFTNHPFLLKYHCVFSAKTHNVMLLEYVDAIDLSVYATSIPMMPEYEVRVISYQLVLAVEHLHLRGFMHMDIKPANILLTKHGHIKLIDFDIGRLCIGHHVRGRTMPFYINITATEHDDENRFGTWYFMPPEVMVQTGPFGRAVDWWSVGVTMFAMMNQTLPFVAKNNRTFVDAIVEDEHEWRTKNFNYTSELISFVDGLLVKDCRKRLGSTNIADIKYHAIFHFLDPEPWRQPILIDTHNFRTAFRRIVSKMPPKAADQDRIADEDIDIVEHKPELTHLSPQLRRLVIHVKEGHNTNCDCKQEFLAIPPASEAINYYDNSARTMIHVDVPGMGPPPVITNPQIEQKTIIVSIQLEPDIHFDDVGIVVEETVYQNGNPALIVTDVKPGSLAALSGLVFGDILLTVNNRQLLTHQDLESELENSIDSIHFETHIHSIARTLLKNEISMADLITEVPTTPMALEPRIFNAIVLKEIQSWSAMQRRNIPVMVVASTPLQLRASPGGIFAGDVVDVVSKSNVSVICNIAATSLLRGYSSIMHKDVAPVLYKYYESLF